MIFEFTVTPKDTVIQRKKLCEITGTHCMWTCVYILFVLKGTYHLTAKISTVNLHNFVCGLTVTQKDTVNSHKITRGFTGT